MATVNINTDRVFKDLDLNFNIHPVKKDINTHSNEYAVINAVKNLVLTQHYEKPFHPEIGSQVRSMLFENVDSIVASRLERALAEVIDNYEPRASVSQIVATPAPEENGYKVELEFYILNLTDPVNITFFLERIR